MSGLSRREFLAWPLALLLGPRAAGAASRRSTYTVEAGLLWGLLTFRLAGTILETVDRAGGRYAVTAAGEGDDIANHTESSGLWRQGRWAPLRTASRVVVHGRRSEVHVTYDYARGVADYRSRSETFFLRRLRVAEDTVPLPAGQPVDDAVSAILNYADGLWNPEPDGTFRTWVLRRRRRGDEGPDDVERSYRAELVPLGFRVEPDPATGQPTALFDLSRFSSWARESRPARVVFGADRRPTAISSALILGTSLVIRIAAA